MNIDILKARKKELGLTNRQLAEISGVSLGTINKIFSGATRYPQLDTMDALISALGLDSLQYHPVNLSLLIQSVRKTVITHWTTTMPFLIVYMQS